MNIQTLTPILHVEAIEPMLAFWEDRLAFKRVAEVMEGDRLGFVILIRDGAQLMVQTRESLEADAPVVASTPFGGGILYFRIADLDAVMAALEGAEALEGVEWLVPRRTTPYGAEEVWIREPGGNVVGFAEFREHDDAAPEADRAD